MNLIDLQRELQIKDDINKCNTNELLEKYGNNINTSISFIRSVNRLFSRYSHYPFYVYDEYSKIKEVSEKLSEKYESDILKTSCKTLDSKIERELKNAKTYDEKASLRNQALGLRVEELGGLYAGAISTNYTNTVSAINEELKEFNSYRFKSYNYLNAKIVKNEIAKYTRLKNSDAEFDLSKTSNKIYREYPLLHFCFDEKFLVLTNYILTSFADDEIKLKVADIAKNVMDVSIHVTPDEDFTKGYYDRRDYAKLAKFTANAIKRYEKIYAKNQKAEEQVAKAEVENVLRKSL